MEYLKEIEAKYKSMEIYELLVMAALGLARSSTRDSASMKKAFTSATAGMRLPQRKVTSPLKTCLQA